MIKICPHCNERYITDPNVHDFVHECNSGNSAIDQDDVVVIGNWEDFTGTGSISAQDVLRQGMVNELFGRDADIEGMDKERLTRRGVRKSTHRQRQHLEFIEEKC